MKRFVFVCLLVLLAHIAEAKSIVMIGDSIADWAVEDSEDIATSIYGRLKTAFEAQGHTVLPSTLLPDELCYSGGWGGATSIGWKTTNGGVCATDSCFKRDCISNSHAQELIILGIGYNDMAGMSNAENFPNQIYSVLDNLKDIVLHAQSLGMRVVYVSHYPLPILLAGDENGIVGNGDGSALDDCTTGETCIANRNANYNFLITQLAVWFAQNNVTYIDFFHYRVLRDTPDDAFVLANGNADSNYIHINQEAGLAEYATFILSGLISNTTSCLGLGTLSLGVLH